MANGKAHWVAGAESVHIVSATVSVKVPLAVHSLINIILYVILNTAFTCHKYSDKYEGRSINKLQNSIFLVILQNMKNPNIHFVRNFMLSTSCELYYDDVTTFIDIKCSNVAVQSIP